MEVVRIQNTMKKLFEKIVEPDYIMNNYNADSLIEKLSHCPESETCLLKLPLLSDLIIVAWNQTDNAHNSVKVFLTRILAVASKKELHFTKLFSKLSDSVLAGFKQINSLEMSASLRVAYMEVALAIVEHNSGLSWLLESGVWKEILSLCNEKRTVFVVRQTYKFAAIFLWKLNDAADQVNIKIILSFILQPFQQIDLINVENITSEQEEEMSKTVEPMLQILLSIVNAGDRIRKTSLLLRILIHDIQVIPHICIALDRIRKEETTMLIAKLIFWYGLAKLFLNKPSTSQALYEIADVLEINASYSNALQYFLSRRNALLVIDYCTACTSILGTVLKNEDIVLRVTEDKQLTLGNQMLFVSMVPLIVFVKQKRPASKISDQAINDYIFDSLKGSCEQTARAAYAMRDLIWELDILPITLHSVKKLTCIKDYLDNEQANLVFKALFYVLTQYTPFDETGEARPIETYDDTQDKILVMTYVMDTVLSLVKHHNIHWNKSLEVICLYNIVYNILQKSNLTTKFVVASLNVIALTVKKFLPPNLSLLLESKPGSALHELGKLIFLKMHDMHWEVRDSALELLLVCTEISYIKFPPFQKQIMENNLINVAATIAFNDYESYVQASALKCIGAASKIGGIWEQLTEQYPNIQDKLLSMLRHNDEGIVRKEACNVLCDLYQNIKLTPAFKQTLYEHMVSSALSDFHWEVQLCALKFWRIVYQSLLTDQGMLDGTFPPVTFSRETRKIVTLNETEIQKRLLKILDELSSIGCLTVLIKLLHDDSEIETMDTSLTISLEILDILNKYKVPECLKPRADDPKDIEELFIYIKEDEDVNNIAGTSEEIAPAADNVIEGILNADDINLLASIYERHMNLQNNATPNDAPVKPKIKLMKFASPPIFVNYLNSKDFKTVIEEKRKWNDGIRSLPSLLDDILGIYEVNDEVNSMDCY